MKKKAATMSTREKGTLVLLLLMYAFMMADSRIMSAIIPELMAEYGTSKQVLGSVGTAFVIVGAAASVAAGFFSDRVSRKKLLVVVVLVGEVPCLLTGFELFTGTFTGFVVLRILTGVGLGGITPLMYAIIADHFEASRRGRAAAGVLLAFAVGALLGPAIAGYVTESMGWRLGFILAASPNFPLALVFLLLVRKPDRAAPAGHRENGATEKRRFAIRDVKTIFSKRTNLLSFAQGLFGSVPWAVASFWALSFFEETGPMSKASATTLVLLIGVGAIAGTFVFAALGDRLYTRAPGRAPILCGVATLIGIVPFGLLFNLNLHDTPMPVLGGVAVSAGFFAAAAGANIKAFLMNVNPRENRGTAFGLLSITDAAGTGAGPVLGSLLFLVFGQSGGLTVAILLWIPCGLLLLLIARHIESERNRNPLPE